MRILRPGQKETQRNAVRCVKLRWVVTYTIMTKYMKRQTFYVDRMSEDM